METYLFEAIDYKSRKKFKKVITALDRESAIAEFETSFPEFKWFCDRKIQ